MAPRSLCALSVLLYGVALLPSFYHLATAEDDADMVDDSVDADADLDDLDDAGEPQSFEDSAKELQDKMGQLQELLNAKGGPGADPELMERLAGLQGQLGELGLGGAGAGGPGLARDQDLAEALAGCVALSARKAGVISSKTMEGLKQLSNGLTREEGAKVEVVRMVSVCVDELTLGELALFGAGTLLELPRAMSNKAITSDGRKAVQGADDETWAAMSKAAKAKVKELVAETSPVKKNSPGSTLGLLMLVPLVVGIGFMIKKLLDMQQDGEKKGKPTSGNRRGQRDNDKKKSR